MTTQNKGAVPGWDPSVPTLTTLTTHHDAATIMDGIKLGLGMAVAWLILVPLIVVAVMVAIGSLA